MTDAGPADPATPSGQSDPESHVPAGLPGAGSGSTPTEADPVTIQRWFAGVMDEEIPEADGTLETARRTAGALARRAKADNTRRAYRAGVRAWCAWCARHGLPALPARPADIAAFLSEQRFPPPPAKPCAVNTVRLRAAAIRYLHYVARLPSPTGTAEVTETLAGITREAGRTGDGPHPKLAARIMILHEILAPIGEDLSGLRDRALLLVGFAGAFRRSELARIRVEHLEETEHGVRVALPLSKGDRQAKGTVVGIPYGRSDLCPIRALRRWLAAAGIATGPLFRRIWVTPRPANPQPGWTPTLVVGTEPLDPGSIARIIKVRGAAAGFDPSVLSGHSLKRGAMNTAKDRRVHPAQIKQLGRHASYATLAAYLEEGDLFADNALNGVL